MKAVNRLTRLGEETKIALIRRGMSHQELADRVGCGANYLSMILHGQKRGGKYAERICEVLDLPYKAEYEERGA